MDADHATAVDQRTARQRAGARRTAVAIGLVAAVIYVAFLLRGILNA
ncbi:MAG: hypothetical protein ACK59M_10590 [Pseudomonadota bacterium]|jgi:hypothetical protein